METGQKRSRTVSWEEPYEVPRVRGRTHRARLLRDVFSGKLPPPPITATLGFRGVEVGEGTAVFEGDPGEHLYNPIGSVHGGFAMTLLDSAMGCAIHTTLGAGERYTTLEVKANFVRPITTETGACGVKASSCTAAPPLRPPKAGFSLSTAASSSRTGRRGV
jgi:uncharacterized protein (TIGR00369 family)